MSYSNLIESHEERLQRLELQLPDAQAAQKMQEAQLGFLTGAMKDVFQQTDARIEKVAEQVEGLSGAMDRKLEKMDSKMEAMKNSIDTKLDAQADKLSGSIDKMTESFTVGFSHINRRLDEGVEQFREHSTAIAALQAAEKERKEFKAKAWGFTWKATLALIPSVVGLFHEKLGHLISEILK